MTERGATRSATKPTGLTYPPPGSLSWRCPRCGHTIKAHVNQKGWYPGEAYCEPAVRRGGALDVAPNLPAPESTVGPWICDARGFTTKGSIGRCGCIVS